MRNLILSCLLILTSCVCLTACKDDSAGLPRLFRPSFIASSCYAEGNSITLAWRTSAEPTSYTVELSESSSFPEDGGMDQVVSGNKCVFTNLKYETVYYARVRANNEAMGLTSNWTVYETSITTLSRTIPKLLYPVDEMTITESSAWLEWTGDGDANPVDGVMLWTEDEWDADAPGTYRALSSSELADKACRLTGLTPRTVYYVSLWNSAAQEGAENYNEQRFKTGGMPQGAISVMDGADLYAKIKEGMADGTRSELVFCLQNGQDYYLNEQGTSDGKTSTISLTKSIALLANPGEHPTLYVREGGFQVGTNPQIDYFVVENVDVEENKSETSRGSKTYLFGVGKRSAGNDFTIDRFEIRNSFIKLPTGVIMMNESNDGVATINHIRIDDCLVTGINDTKYVSKPFGFIHAPKKGGDVWHDVEVSNSTFYEFYISPGIFGSLEEGASVAGGGKVSVSNCTFYNWATQKASNTIIGNFSKITSSLDITVTGCVFGLNAGKVLEAGTCVVTGGNNYCTSGFEQLSNAGVTLVAMDCSDDELFRNPESGDYTIMDTSSVVYMQEYGDPRWIMINGN